MDVGSAGARAQTAGLAAAVAELCGGAEIAAQTIRGSAAAGMFPRLASRFLSRFDSLPPDIAIDLPPDIAIVCGHRTAAAALAIRRCGAFVVFAQKPPVSPRFFDAVICPMHDEIRGANVLPILGSAGGVRIKDMQNRRESARAKFAHIPNPKTALLIGGESRAYKMTPAFCRELAESSLRADLSGGMLATASRRTGAENIAALRAAFAEDSRAFFYGGGGGESNGGGGENPYMDILAAADRFIVSADSVNMLSEAAMSAKPLWFALPPQKSARAARKFRRFHDALVARNIARKWAGDFAECAGFSSATPLDETARAAEFIWRRYCESRGIRYSAAADSSN